MDSIHVNRYTPDVGHTTDENEKWKFHNDAAVDYCEGSDTYFAVFSISDTLN